MGQVKQIERNLINNAAGHYLSDQEEGDLYDAYQKLVEVSNEGQGDKCASDFVEIWQPLEYKTVDEILDLIEGSKKSLEDFDEKNPINRIDFTELRNQKRTLLESMNFIQKSGIRFDPSVDTEQIIDDLTGILYLLDEIQDFAVDHLGWDQNLVFDFDDEESRED